MGSSFGSLYVADVEQVLLAVASRDPAHAHDDGLDGAVQRATHAIALATVDAGVGWRAGGDEVAVRLAQDGVRAAAEAAPLPPSRVWDLTLRLDAVLTRAWRAAAATDEAQWPRPYDVARDMVRVAARSACETGLAHLAAAPGACARRFRVWHERLAELAVRRGELRVTHVLREQDRREAAARVQAVQLVWASSSAPELEAARVVPLPSGAAASLAWSAEDEAAPWARFGAALRPALREAYDARGWACGWADARRIAAAVAVLGAGVAAPSQEVAAAAAV